MKEIFHLFVKSLGEEEMEWMAWGVAEVILADGRVVTPEMYFLKVLLYNVREKEKVMDISNYVIEKNRKHQIEFLDVDDDLAIEMLQFFVKVAAADGVISPEEEKVIIFLGSRLGFDYTVTSEIIQTYKKILNWKKHAKRNRKGSLTASEIYSGFKLKG